ncbi:MAG: hypothetical protein LQ338_007116, partial [Usnochroma carphineum]
TIAEADRDALIHQLAELLPNLQQDPTPLTSLIEILIRPSSYTFSRVLIIRPPVDFSAGLNAPLPAINLVTLCLLEKAKLRRSDADIVAGKPDVVASLIKLWLSTPETAVSQKAHDVFLGLLTAGGCQKTATAADDVQIEPHQQSLIWRRVFRDKDIYESIYRICSLKNAGQDGELSKREKTVAQARLLDLLVKIDCETIRVSQNKQIEDRYGAVRDGLLEFAAVRMVDYEDDVLMHMTLMDFFANLLKPDHSIVEPFAASNSSHSRHSSTSLDFLLHWRLHSRTISYYLDPSRHSSLDLTYLYGRSANYLATYCSSYPERFLSDGSECVPILRRVVEALKDVTPGQWAQDRIPKHDLHVLASLPEYSLLPNPLHETPLFLLPTQPLNAAALQTLATVFRGPSRNEVSYHVGAGLGASSKSVARALYFLYLRQNPRMWHDVVKGAETVALKDVALAAIALIEAVISASWSPLPSDRDDDLPLLPSETKLAEKCHSSQHLPPSGVLAILATPALETVLPYLLQPAQTFSNLVGGGKGDVESAAYRVAAAKYDALLSLKFRLKEVVQETGQLDEVITAVDKRLALGVMGGQGDIGVSAILSSFHFFLQPLALVSQYIDFDDLCLVAIDGCVKHLDRQVVYNDRFEQRLQHPRKEAVRRLHSARSYNRPRYAERPDAGFGTSARLNDGGGIVEPFWVFDGELPAGKGDYGGYAGVEQGEAENFGADEAGGAGEDDFHDGNVSKDRSALKLSRLVAVARYQHIRDDGIDKRCSRGSILLHPEQKMCLGASRNTGIRLWRVDGAYEVPFPAQTWRSLTRLPSTYKMIHLHSNHPRNLGEGYAKCFASSANTGGMLAKSGRILFRAAWRDQYDRANIAFAIIIVLALFGMMSWNFTIRKGTPTARKLSIWFTAAISFAIVYFTWSFIDWVLNEEFVSVEQIYRLFDIIFVSFSYVADILLLAAVLTLMVSCMVSANIIKPRQISMVSNIHLALFGVLGLFWLVILALRIALVAEDVENTCKNYVSIANAAAKLDFVLQLLYLIVVFEFLIWGVVLLSSSKAGVAGRQTPTIALVIISSALFIRQILHTVIDGIFNIGSAEALRHHLRQVLFANNMFYYICTIIVYAVLVAVMGRLREDSREVGKHEADSVPRLSAPEPSWERSSLRNHSQDPIRNGPAVVRDV